MSAHPGEPDRSSGETRPLAANGTTEPEGAGRLPLQDTLVAGRYLLGEALGSGGVADVYRAVDQSLGRQVAVKVFRPGAGPDLGKHRFEIEGRTLARLHHPHLVTLYDAGFSEERAYLVLQLVEGTTLSERLREGPLPPAETARIGVALADALSYVHTNKVMHRDVKPSNVLLDEDGGVYLTDFGIARTEGDPGITSTGMVVGSAAYLAPEQVSGQGVELASDVYALGLVLLECLTGRRVYEGSLTAVALARLTQEPAIPEELSPEWQGLLRAMTRRDPRERPSSREVAAQLDRIARGEVVAASEALAAGEAPPTLLVAGGAGATAAAGGTATAEAATGEAATGAATETAAEESLGRREALAWPLRGRRLVALLASCAVLGVAAAFALGLFGDRSEGDRTPGGNGNPGGVRTVAPSPGSGSRGTDSGSGGGSETRRPTAPTSSRPTSASPSPTPRQTAPPTTPPASSGPPPSPTGTSTPAPSGSASPSGAPSQGGGGGGGGGGDGGGDGGPGGGNQVAQGPDGSV